MNQSSNMMNLCCWNGARHLILILKLSLLIHIGVIVLGQPQADEGGCCSWDLKTCKTNSQHCTRPETCQDCNFYWISDTSSSTCRQRKQGCGNHEQCCGPMVCVELISAEDGITPYQGCDLSHCCSIQGSGECMLETPHCNYSPERCAECNANAIWVDRRTLPSASNEPETANAAAAPAPTVDPAADEDHGCCSWNFRDCIPQGDFCAFSTFTCEACNMYWIQPLDQPTDTCIPRRAADCETDQDCCGTTPQHQQQQQQSLACLTVELKQRAGTYNRCDLGYCCSENLLDCSDREYCNYSEEHCDECEEGMWIQRKFHQQCLPRWDPCSTSEQCCGPDGLMECRQVPGFSGPVCELVNDTGNGNDNDTEGSDNNDPIVPASQSAERVIIPHPPVPELVPEDERTFCPHHDQGLDNWHSANTWPNQQLPTEGQNVTIPDNSRVVIRRSLAVRLGIITIPLTSELIIDERNAGIEIHAQGINVLGKLTAGSETCRITKPITITLHGERPPQPNPDNLTYKGIAVSGTISLHGQRHYRTWTRLARTAHPGDRELLLQHAVNWERFQQVVLVTTALKDARDWHLNEVVQVQQVETDPAKLPQGVGASVRLLGFVLHTHAANFNYQAEVGLLSRTIVIQGAEDDSEPSDPDPGPGNCAGGPYWGGDTSVPCPDKELTGFGGHIVIHSNGRGHIAGVELYRMGKTNIAATMNFRLLGDCPECYVRDSSFHHSFYRCVSVQGTHQMLLSENVAYDVVGHCFYLEHGVETDNLIEFNLASHIHFIGDPPGEPGIQFLPSVRENEHLASPSDVIASGFFISNMRNTLVGNAASGGWTGFAFPSLPRPTGSFRDINIRPASATSLEIDGNTAHSSGWWWSHSGGFYFGGILAYNNDLLEFNPGRSVNAWRDDFRPCRVDPCTSTGGCMGDCPPGQEDVIRITNTKTFLTAGAAFTSWSGVMEVIGYEAHDTGLPISAFSDGFWLNNMLAVCRTDHEVSMPSLAFRPEMSGTGYFFFDDQQKHILTDITFRKCGYRHTASTEFYDTNITGDGCGGDAITGCAPSSAVFRFQTTFHIFAPEIMQATKNITYEDCGRRFSLDNAYGTPATVAGRAQSVIDADGTLSQLLEPTLVGSGLEESMDWWGVDHDVVVEPEGPLSFIKKNNGPERALGHIELLWDDEEHDRAELMGSDYCWDMASDCTPLGYLRHTGRMFSPVHGENRGPGLPITANADVVGLTGGFGWILKLSQGAPRRLRIRNVEVVPSSPLLISIAYPRGTNFTLTALASRDCDPIPDYSCEEQFVPVDSIPALRRSTGNAYYVDADGVLSFRVVQTPVDFVGRPNWFLPQYSDLGRHGDGSRAIHRFQRDGISLPKFAPGPQLIIEAKCNGEGPYCETSEDEPLHDYDPDVCPFSDYLQTGYDTCCSEKHPDRCIFSNGSYRI